MTLACFDRKVIAEIGSVHDGSFGNAMKAIELAKSVGADAVKFQTHCAEDETLRDAPSPTYFSGEPRFEYFQRTAFDSDQWARLKKHADNQGILFLSSPFSHKAVEILEQVGAPAYKVASGEVANTPLLEAIAATGKPVFLSSGMSNWAELDKAVATLTAGTDEIAILQCSSVYPCPPERVGLNVIPQMRARYKVDIGFSDHTTGIAAGVSAAAIGACIVEKHLTFSRHMYGSDAALAMEPDSFRRYVQAVREAWQMASAPVDKDDLSDYSTMKKIFQKSVVLAHPIAAGHVLTRADLAFKKPGDGICASRYAEVIGRRSVRALDADTKLSLDDLA